MSNIQNTVSKVSKICRFCNKNIYPTNCFDCNYYVSSIFNEAYYVMFNIIDNGELIFERVAAGIYEPEKYSHTLFFLFEPNNIIIRIDDNVLSKQTLIVKNETIIEVANPQNTPPNQLKTIANKLIKNLYLI